MKFDKSWTGNWENAFRGLRHPLESYAKSDSNFGICSIFEYSKELILTYKDNPYAEYVKLGPNDLDLAQRMIKAGSPNDKFLRQIFVSVDITAPLYWWKEMDTYKVATVANSTSTMHKLASTPITADCFEMDDYTGDLEVYNNEPYQECFITDDIWEEIINHCETLRLRYLETKDKRYWKELIRLLPESWLQTRTWTANYATLRNIIHWREGHRLTEWASFIDWCHTLPYADELLFYEQKSN